MSACWKLKFYYRDILRSLTTGIKSFIWVAMKENMILEKSTHSFEYTF